MKVKVSYDADKLSEKIASLKAVTGEQTPAVSAYPKFDGKQYVVEPEQYGTAIQKERLEKRIAEALLNLEELFELEKEGCYAAPPYTSESEEVQAACGLMNQYCSARIVYPMNEQVVVDGSVALETDVVTGQPISEKITPEGTYSILEKGRNRVLVGSVNPATGEPSYRMPVSYWMRVTWSGIGFHDAAWQSAFGGSSV